MAAWSELVSRAERWLLPAECTVCRSPLSLPDDSLVCGICRSRWRTIPPPYCAVCGEPAPLGLECRVCAGWPPDFGPVRSAVRLDPVVRRLVHRFKYMGWRRLAEDFATRMAPMVRNAPNGDLVPIPLAPRRLASRGYNQAEQLAIALGRLTGLPVCADRLQRRRDTPTQTRLTPERRRANLAEAFGATDCHRPVILVDDVFTTGATLCSAAAELLDRGAEAVGGITFARAELPLAAQAKPLR
jgi:ComF family protein